MRSGIYKLTCIVNNKSYIGKTEGNIEKRVMAHLNGQTPTCVAIFNAVKKYGKENFTWEILHEGIIPELLDIYEIEAIAEFNTVTPNGYNLTFGGEGGTPSEETIRKLSGENNHMFGKSLSKEQREQLSIAAKKRTGEKNPFYGKNHTAETCLKISKNNKGKPAHNKSPLRIPVRELFDSLPDNMPLFEKRKVLYGKFPELDKSTLQRWVKEWTGVPSSNSSPYSHYHIPARELLCSLPPDMTPLEKSKILYEKFPDVPHPTIRHWIRKWDTNAKSKKEQAYEIYRSLPNSLPLTEKRQILKNKFEVPASTLRRWIREWTGIASPTGSPCNPIRPEVHEYFLSLPSDMDLKEKRKLILKKFENVVHRHLINRWTKQWQSELTPKGEQK